MIQRKVRTLNKFCDAHIVIKYISSNWMLFEQQLWHHSLWHVSSCDIPKGVIVMNHFPRVASAKFEILFRSKKHSIPLRNAHLKLLATDPHTQVPLLDRSAPFLNDIAVSKDGVIKLLKGLNPSKALGPDELHPRVLKELATELGPVFAHLFQQSTLVKSQRNGLLQISAPFSRRVTGHLRAIIAQFPWLVYLASYSNT